MALSFFDNFLRLGCGVLAKLICGIFFAFKGVVPPTRANFADIKAFRPAWVSPLKTNPKSPFGNEKLR
jgi:hypothetical protein